MAFFVDTFTETVDTTLSAHTPDTGTSWTLLWQSSTANWIVEESTDQVSPTSASDAGSIYTADATYPSADYHVEFTLVVLGPTVRCIYALVRVQDAENMYAVRLSTGTDQCRLYKKVSGTWTPLGATFAAPANGSVCKLEIIGSALKFYDDGVEVASATDTDITAAGKAGIAAGGGAELVNTVDDSNSINIIDGFSVEDLGGAAEPSPSVSDAVTVSDSASLGAIVIPDLQESEAVTVSESVKAELTIEVAAAEAVTVGETTALDPVAPTEAVATEAVTVAENVKSELTIEVTDAEAVTVSDTTTLDPVAPTNALAAEAVGVVDTSTLDPVFPTEISEAQPVTVADVAGVSIPVEGAIDISVSDSVSVGDTASLENALPGINVALDNPFYIVTGVKVVS